VGAGLGGKAGWTWSKAGGTGRGTINNPGKKKDAGETL